MPEEPREVTTLRRLHQLMSRVNARQDLHEVLQDVADGVADVTSFEVAAISHLRSDRTLEVVAVAGDAAAQAELLGKRTPLEDILAEFALAEEWGVLRFVPHERLPDGVGAGWVPNVQPLDVPDAWHPMDALLAPLSSPSGDLVGLMSVDLPSDQRRPGRFQREVLEMYAVQAGVAISNAQQHAALVERVRLGETTHAIARTAGRELDLGRVIDDSVQPIVAGLRCAGAWLRTFEGQGEAPGRGRGAMHPADAPLVPPDEITSIARRLAIACWERQEAVTISASMPPGGLATQQEVDRVLEFVARIGSTSVLLAPMGAGPECLGYLAVTRGEGFPPWSEEEVSSAQAIGRDLGRALLHARLFERERQVAEELRQLDEYKTKLVSTLTHELKNPLTSILLSLEMVQDAGEDNNEAGSWLAMIERNTGRLRALVDDLLVLSKVSDPHQPLVPVYVDMAAVVRETADAFCMQAKRRGVGFCLTGVDRPSTVWGDAGELDRVVTNLVANAVKFSPDGGEVSLGLERRDGVVVLTCRDQGLGIGAQDQEQLFHEFFRSTNPVARALPGSGLGLSIVRRIVDRHDGTIEVVSGVGEGSTFTVTLPTRPEPEAPVGTNASEGPS